MDDHHPRVLNLADGRPSGPLLCHSRSRGSHSGSAFCAGGIGRGHLGKVDGMYPPCIRDRAAFHPPPCQTRPPRLPLFHFSLTHHTFSPRAEPPPYLPTSIDPLGRPSRLATFFSLLRCRPPSRLLLSTAEAIAKATAEATRAQVSSLTTSSICHRRRPRFPAAVDTRRSPPRRLYVRVFSGLCCVSPQPRCSLNNGRCTSFNLGPVLDIFARVSRLNRRRAFAVRASLHESWRQQRQTSILPDQNETLQPESRESSRLFPPGPG